MACGSKLATLLWSHDLHRLRSYNYLKKTLLLNQESESVDLYYVTSDSRSNHALRIKISPTHVITCLMWMYLIYKIDLLLPKYKLASLDIWDHVLVLNKVGTYNGHGIKTDHTQGLMGYIDFNNEMTFEKSSLKPQGPEVCFFGF